VDTVDGVELNIGNWRSYIYTDGHGRDGRNRRNGNPADVNAGLNRGRVMGFVRVEPIGEGWGGNKR